MGFLFHVYTYVTIVSVLIGYIYCQCKLNCNSGTCSEASGVSSCVCDIGYRGEYCDIISREPFCEGVSEQGYKWPDTKAGGIAAIKCNSSGSTKFEGVINRPCGVGGVWKGVNLKNCTNPKFNEIQQQLNQLGGERPGAISLSDCIALADTLIEATTPPSNAIGAYIGPLNLVTAVECLHLLQLAINQKLGIEKKEAIEGFGTQWLGSFSNVIDLRNSLSFMSPCVDALSLVNILVSSLESITRNYAEFSTRERMIEHQNLQIIGGPVYTTLKGNVASFPITTPMNWEEEIQFDSDHLKTIRTHTGTNTTVFIGMSVSTGLSEIINAVLNSSEIGNGYTPISRFVTVGVGGQRGRIEFSSPVNITLAIPPKYSDSSYVHKCAYWNASLRVWSRDGVYAGGGSVANRFVCSSSHLTSFSVLSNASLNSTNEDLSSLIIFVLSIITYVLSIVSIIALIAAIVIFLLLGKELYKKDLYMAHFNYAISLTLSLAMFVIAVQSATVTNSPIACGIIAGIVHYTFLSVFAWSFCEAVLIVYLLFVLLGTRRIIFYLMLVGWGLPIPIVIVTVSARWYNYGVPGKHCWVSTENGVIWSFIAPALVIILINFVLLIISIVRIVSGLDTSNRQMTQVKQAKLAAIGTLLLVPLLGIPCAVAIPNFFFPIPLFQWIFVLLNTPQGPLFFLTYVLSNRYLVMQVFRKKNEIETQRERHTELRRLRETEYSTPRSSQYRKSIRGVEMNNEGSMTFKEEVLASKPNLVN